MIFKIPKLKMRGVQELLILSVLVNLSNTSRYKGIPYFAFSLT